MGVPRNVASRVETLDNAYVYDMDDLQSVADANTNERRRESDFGEAIVTEEQIQFENWLNALEAVPTIRHLRARAEAIRERELDRMAGRLALDSDQREGVAAITRAIVNKLLHAPVAHLRNEVDGEARTESLDLARVMFALDDNEAPGAEADAALREEMEGVRLSDSAADDHALSNPSNPCDEEDE
jgi:glutamyl-tRNA reductase